MIAVLLNLKYFIAPMTKPTGICLGQGTYFQRDSHQQDDIRCKNMQSAKTLTTRERSM